MKSSKSLRQNSGAKIVHFQASTIFSTFSMFEMTLADGLCDENPHQAWYWDHSSLCLNWFLLLETPFFFFLLKFPISICRSPNTFWRWKPRTWAHEIDAGFGYSRFSIKPWCNSFFPKTHWHYLQPKGWICGAQRKIFFFCFVLFTLVTLRK